MTQLDCEKSSLQPFETKVISRHPVLVFPNRTVVPIHSHPLRKLGVVSDDCSAFSEATKILAGIEAEESRDPNAARLLLLERSTGSLASVLNQVKIVALRDVLQSLQVGTLSVQMHGQQSRGTRRDCCLYLRRIHVIGNRIHVYKYRAGANCTDRLCRRDESVWHRDDFLPRSDTQAQQNQLQCSRTGIHRDAFG